MPAQLKEKDIIPIKQYITNKKGHKVAAIVDIKELNKVSELLEDLLDVKAIDDRKDESTQSYKTYSKNRKSKI